jgi:hypothetical protein
MVNKFLFKGKSVFWSLIFTFDHSLFTFSDRKNKGLKLAVIDDYLSMKFFN